MLSKAEVKHLYRGRAAKVSSGGEFFLKLPDAVEFVRTCEKNNLSILGVEGFLYRGGYIYPQLDMIADYSPSVLSIKYLIHGRSIESGATEGRSNFLTV